MSGRATPPGSRSIVGSLAGWLHQLASGIDERPVVPNRKSKSSGSENTFAEDLTDFDAMQTEVAGLAGRAAQWLASRSLLARTITLKVRYADFTTITRSQTADPTRDGNVLVARAIQLLQRTDAQTRPVRLLGVSVHNFCNESALLDPPDWLPFREGPIS